MSCVPVRGQRKGTGYHCLWRVPAIAKQVPPPEGTMMCSESSLGPLSRGTLPEYAGVMHGPRPIGYSIANKLSGPKKRLGC